MSSRQQLNRDQGDLWDSGKLAGYRTAKAPYGGKVPKPRTDYWWKAQVLKHRDGDKTTKNAHYQCKQLIAELANHAPAHFAMQPVPLLAEGKLLE